MIPCWSSWLRGGGRGEGREYLHVDELEGMGFALGCSLQRSLGLVFNRPARPAPADSHASTASQSGSPRHNNSLPPPSPRLAAPRRTCARLEALAPPCATLWGSQRQPSSLIPAHSLRSRALSHTRSLSVDTTLPSPPTDNPPLLPTCRLARPHRLRSSGTSPPGPSPSAAASARDSRP